MAIDEANEPANVDVKGEEHPRMLLLEAVTVVMVATFETDLAGDGVNDLVSDSPLSSSMKRITSVLVSLPA